MRAFVVAVLLVLVAARSSAAQENADSVPDVLSSSTQLSTLNKYVQKSPAVKKLLDAAGGFQGTFFAPSNAAFSALGDKLSDRQLQDILLYHIVPGPPHAFNNLNDGQVFITALKPKTITAKYEEGRLSLVDEEGNSARITNADTTIGPAQYGVIHEIDEVLLPFRVSGRGSGSAGSSSASDSVDAADIAGGAGAAVGELGAPGKSAVEVLLAANLTSLVEVAELAGLTGELGAAFSGTLFAPTEDAITALLEELGSGGLDPALAREILLYHIVNDTLRSSEIAGGQMLTTAGGGIITAMRQDGQLYLNDAAGRPAAVVVEADLPAADGLVHVIDSALLPRKLAAPTEVPPVQPAAPSGAAGRAAGLSAALLAAALAAALA